MNIKKIRYLVMNIKLRNNCVVCEKDNLIDLYNYQMPIYMGTNKSIIYNTSNMTFTECQCCNNIQIKEEIDLSVLYQSNHNIGIIGKIWENHYNFFVDFIKDDIINKTILEISDPSAKIAKKSVNYKKWVIIEPNPDENDSENIVFIKDFFDENLKIDFDIDIIIHSHLLEHIHNPNLFFNTLNNKLNIGGSVIFSIPNMESLTKKNVTPNNILHFEHTYYLDSNTINYLSNKHGFKIIKEEKYLDHSIFYKLIKIDTTNNDKIKFKKNKHFFNKSLIKNKEYVEKINNLDYKNIYLYGSHVNSQFLLSIGLKNVINILDNSQYKINNFLYSTNLLVKSPKIIENDETPIIFLSHMGVYLEEIKITLLNINKNCIFI